MVNSGIKCLIRCLIMFLILPVSISACLVDFDLSNTTWSMGPGSYQSFNTTDYTQAVQFDVNVNTQGECSYFLSFSDGGQTGYARLGTAGADTLSYNLYKDVGLTNVLKGSSDFVSINDAMTGTVTTGNAGAYTHTLYFNTPAQQIEASASYADTITVDLYEGEWDDIPSATLIQSKSIVFTIPVASSVTLSLEDNDFSSNPNHSADLGTLYDGIFYDLNFYIQSNDGYRIKLQSANSETMITGLANETPLPFEFRVDGALVDLSSGTSVEAVSTALPTIQTGKLYVGKLTIPDVSGVFNGSYSDTIMYTVELL